MNKSNKGIVFIVGVLLVATIVAYYYVRNRYEADQIYIYSTNVYKSGVIQCSQKRYVSLEEYQTKEIKMNNLSTKDFKDDGSKAPFASPRYSSFKEIHDYNNQKDPEHEYDEDELRETVSIQFDYGNGLSLNDDGDELELEYSNCYDRYEYNEEQKTITLRQTHRKTTCEDAPESIVFGFEHLYEQEKTAYLTLNIRGKKYEFAADILDIKETNIDLASEYRLPYTCQNQTSKDVEEILGFVENEKSGSYILVIDKKIEYNIPLKYKTIQYNNKNYAIIYSEGEGIYLNLEIGKDRLSNPNFETYLHFK